MKQIDATTWEDDNGYRVVRVHNGSQCQGEFCVIHNPSEHVMSRYPRVMSHQTVALVMRVCPHGDLHPDPDSLAYMINTRAAQYTRSNAMHHNEYPNEPPLFEIDLAEIANEYDYHDCCDHQCCVKAYPVTWQHRQ